MPLHLHILTTASGTWWSDNFKDELKSGAHKISAKAIDEYGKEHHGLMIFEVADDQMDGKAGN
jgi:hypothetical protein